MKKLAELLKRLNIYEDVLDQLTILASQPGEKQQDARKALAIYNSMFEQGGIEDEYYTCTTTSFMEKNGYFAK